MDVSTNARKQKKYRDNINNILDKKEQKLQSRNDNGTTNVMDFSNDDNYMNISHGENEVNISGDEENLTVDNNDQDIERFFEAIDLDDKMNEEDDDDDSNNDGDNAEEDDNDIETGNETLYQGFIL
ncbi:unnamed protein product, partial [Didymodactylos carnosus]